MARPVVRRNSAFPVAGLRGGVPIVLLLMALTIAAAGGLDHPAVAASELGSRPAAPMAAPPSLSGLPSESYVTVRFRSGSRLRGLTGLLAEGVLA
ncbi:MAG: hypothetical protein AAB289_06265, partial [Chloroflexota bacterium]